MDGVLAVGVVALVDTVDNQTEKGLVVVSADCDCDEVWIAEGRAVHLIIAVGGVGAGTSNELERGKVVCRLHEHWEGIGVTQTDIATVARGARAIAYWKKAAGVVEAGGVGIAQRCV